MRSSTHISKGITAIFAALTTLVGSHSVMASVNPECEYFEQSAVSQADTEVSKLLERMTTGSAVEICTFPEDSGESADLVYVFGPIRRKEQVSYFNLSMFRVPDGERAAKVSLIELTARRPIAKFKMMALDQDASLTHKSEEFIETYQISIAQFKRLYTEWTSIFESANWDSLNDSQLGGDGKIAFADLVKSATERREWRINSVNSSKPALFGLYPRFVIEFSINGEYWMIKFESGHSKGFTLLSVSQAVV